MLAAHQILPFDGVLSAQPAVEPPEGLPIVSLAEADSRFFRQFPHQCHALRIAEDMAAAIEVLLRSAKQLHFIDPNFAPGKDRWWDLIVAVMGRIRAQNGSVSEIKYHADADKALVKGCRDILDRQQKKFIPDGLAVQFYFWRVPPECEERFHDRFIITERMGIQSSYGLDTGTGKTVMTMLDATILDNVWRLFDPGQSPFRLVKNISGGARELR